MTSSDHPIEVLLLKRMKQEMEAHVEKSFQPARALIQFQQREIHELEAKLEASRKNFKYLIKEIDETLTVKYRGKRSEDHSKLSKAIDLCLRKYEAHLDSEKRKNDIVSDVVVDDASVIIKNGGKLDDCESTRIAIQTPTHKRFKPEVSSILAITPITRPSAPRATVSADDSFQSLETTSADITLDDSTKAETRPSLMKIESSADYSSSFFTTMPSDFDSSLGDIATSDDVTMTCSIQTDLSGSVSNEETDTLISDVSPSTSLYDSSLVKTEPVQISVSNNRKPRSSADASNQNSRKGSSKTNETTYSEAASSLLDQILMEPKKIFDVSLSSSSGKRMIDLILDQLPSKRVKKEDATTEIVSLPPDVLVKIFNFVPSDHILNNVVRVCKQFYEASKHPDIRLSIKIGRGRRPQSAEELFSRRGHQIRELVFSFCSVTTMRAISLRSLTNLNSVQFRFLRSKVPIEMFHQMAELKALRRIKFWDLPKDSGLENLTKCKSLQEITTQLYPISKPELESALLSNAISLKLDLSLATEISFEDFVAAFAIAKRPELIRLDLTLNEVTDDHLDTIRANCPGLVHLTFSQSKQAGFFKASAPAIMSSFEACTDLRTIKINSFEGQSIVESVNSYPFESKVVANLEKNVVIIRRQNSRPETLSKKL